MEYILLKARGSSSVHEKMGLLKRKLQHLESKKEDIEELIQAMNSSRKRPKAEVKNWITNVERLKNQLKEVEQEVSKSDRWFTGLQLERSVDNLTAEVTDLINGSKFSRGLSHEVNEVEGLAFLTKELVGETFYRNKEMLWDCLINGNDPIIGVYGMGGVGKTTLIEHIHNQLLNHPNIHVSWVTVSQNFSLQKLQHDIAKTIDLDLSEKDDERKRAAELAKALQRIRKKVILILDDVWEHISLDKVGICVGANVSKLVLTTRSLTVCRMLDCVNPIKVEPLSDVEAWTLFRETLGNQLLLVDHQVEVTAKTLVSECDGLPLGIVVMAGSMRGVEDIHEWRNALEEIREAKYQNEDMEFYDRVVLVLRYSYDKLKDPKVKECLLYCSLFPEDMLIEREKLIEYFIDENLIDGRNSRPLKLHKGHTILNKLENVCLLEGQTDRNGKKYVKMHDLIRDMALKIASAEPYKFWVQASMRLVFMPTDEMSSENPIRVSLMDNNISYIPSSASPKCPGLKTLLLPRNHFLRASDDFFIHMKMLQVLDLSNCSSMKSLPLSISTLESLVTLLLGGCRELQHIPSVENLIALKRLDLSGTAIKDLPKGIEKLTNLSYLNLKCCKNLKTISAGILPHFFHMEWFELDPSIKLSGKEIGNWRKLEHFYGNFDCISDLKTSFKSWGNREPSMYTIFVGFDIKIDYISASVSDKNMHIFRNIDIVDTNALPSSTRSLVLERCNGITSLSSIASLRKARTLKHLYLWNLPKLVDLDLPTNYSFSSLKKLHIQRCHGLKCLFTPAQLSAIQGLERLTVEYCDHLEEIISDEDKDEETITSTNLRSLRLHNLPKLKSLCRSSLRVSNSLKLIWTYDCPELKRITLLLEEENPLDSLKLFRVDYEWWDLVEWKHPQTKAILQPFVRFW